MKDAEDEAFDEIARKQGGGFPAKRAMAADKLQEPVREALKLALEALEEYHYGAARIILRQALEQPAQEPVGFMNVGHVYELQQKRITYGYVYPKKEIGASVAVYTTPSQREWVGLTEEDFSAINQSCLTKLQAATSAESILKKKNA